MAKMSFISKLNLKMKFVYLSAAGLGQRAGLVLLFPSHCLPLAGFFSPYLFLQETCSCRELSMFPLGSS